MPPLLRRSERNTAARKFARRFAAMSESCVAQVVSEAVEGLAFEVAMGAAFHGVVFEMRLPVTVLQDYFCR